LVLQGYFDDSGSHADSPFFVLGGWIASTDAWKTFSTIWDYHLKKEPALEYFKMNEAITWTGQFERGWNVPLRNQRIFELAEVIRRSEPLVRVECFLRRSDFENFVRNILDAKFYSDPYFLCFHHVVLSVAVDPEIGWNKDCDFIFDCHGPIGEHAASWWEQIKQTIGEPVSSRLGTPPLFRDDKNFKPLHVCVADTSRAERRGRNRRVAALTPASD
jgi:hypothetical protein